MKHVIAFILIGLGFIGLALVLRSLFPRPPVDVARLLRPILDARMQSDDSNFERGSPNRKLEDGLDEPVKNQSAAADVASVILLDYYLGEHNGEAQLCSVTSRGRRILPLLTQYQHHPAGLLKPQYELFKLNKRERDSIYQTALDAVQKGQSVGCD